ncbi:MAG: TrmH family RNA methyltransferase [Solirubrobacterales bacterium]
MPDHGTLITSPHNPKLKRIRGLHARRERARTGLFIAEGEDLVAAADAAGVDPELTLVAGRDVEPELLDAVSTLGSGTRVIGVYEQRWTEPGGSLSVFLDGVGDPGNVGTIIRAADALGDGPVVLGSGCADPYSPKAVRASMGSIFARSPARAGMEELAATKIALDAGADAELSGLEPAPPVVICLGAERAGLSEERLASVDARARIPMRPRGPESLNVAMAATVALYELGTRMAARA